ncbi:ATP-binding protein [Streptomyces mirabilis]|uniref:ATP-binding protein n=1 Tax=Streptomyces mirabilis TaxID=68239 RepID=UPI003249745A
MFALPAAPASVGMARRDVREWLTEWGIDPETRDNAILVTSELVTNALTHTASEWIVCRVHVAEERLHIEVEDQHPAGAFRPSAGRGPTTRVDVGSCWSAP